MRKFEKISYPEFVKVFGDNKTLYDDYMLPLRGTKYSAGYDFFAIKDYVIKPNEILKIPTGYKATFESDEMLMIVVRSSMGFKYNVRLTNQVGIIESDYYNNPDNEGHMLVCLQNHGDKEYIINKGDAYAQGIFVNFKNIERSMRLKVPFGICQTGKAFRNEITPGNFIFRTREFEQMELEFFCKPGTDMEWFEYWRAFCKNWLLSLGMKEEKIRLRDHSPEELCFYSKGTTDIEFAFPFGWGELWGIADRTDYDLKQHAQYSGEDFTYLDQETGEKFVPYCVEPSLGCDRVTLAFLCNAYEEQEIAEGDVRTVLHLHPALAPYKVAVLPLSKKLSEKAEEVYAKLSKNFMCDYDEAGSIGKRYRREDEIGTPYCVTIDFDTLEDECVTIRDRDTMEQVRVKIDELESYIQDKIAW